MNSFEVIHLFEETEGVRLGVVYTRVHRNTLFVNIGNTRNIVRYASSIGVKTIILPPLLPYGVYPVAGNYIQIESISLTKRNPYVKILRRLADIYGVSIISPHVIEKSNRGLYISNIFISSGVYTVTYFSRKINITREESSLGMRKGRRLDIVSDNYLNYSVLTGEDISSPELARFLVSLGVDLLLLSDIRNSQGMEIIDFVKALKLFIPTSVIYTGTWISDNEITVNKSPVIISTPDQFIYTYSGEKPVVITIPLKKLKTNLPQGYVSSVREAMELVTRIFKSSTKIRNKLRSL